MPLYEFRCKSCGHKFEELVFSTVADPANIYCPACGKNESERLMSAFSSSGSGGLNLSSSSGCGTGGFT
jgi:putative FmdB family regulatory protein